MNAFKRTRRPAAELSVRPAMLRVRGDFDMRLITCIAPYVASMATSASALGSVAHADNRELQLRR
jgi:hypothetical protein